MKCQFFNSLTSSPFSCSMQPCGHHLFFFPAPCKRHEFPRFCYSFSLHHTSFSLFFFLGDPHKSAADFFPSRTNGEKKGAFIAMISRISTTWKFRKNKKILCRPSSHSRGWRRRDGKIRKKAGTKKKIFAEWPRLRLHSGNQIRTNTRAISQTNPVNFF